MRKKCSKWKKNVCEQKMFQVDKKCARTENVSNGTKTVRDQKFFQVDLKCARTENVPNGTKNVRELKNCKKEQKMLLNECKTFMELY